MEYTLSQLQKKMNETVGGWLDLSDTGITALPEGLTVGGWLDLSGTGITALPEGLTVGGWLDLSGTGITALPDGLTVGGSLYLSDTGITALPEGLTVGGSLNLSDTGITALPEGLTVGGSLDLSDTGITALPEGLTVGDSLDLRGTGITALPDGLTVGGSLYLSDTGITALPEGLTVGDWLDLRGTGITALPDGLTVGDSLDLSGTGITNETYNKLKDGDYVAGKYLYADGILIHVKSCKKIGEYTYYNGKIKGRNVISDGKNYAHCSDLKRGLQDLLFKTAKNRGAKQYQKLSLQDSLSIDEMAVCYRVITGACSQGTKAFIENCGYRGETITISEVIEMTSGKYGHEAFQQFFAK